MHVVCAPIASNWLQGEVRRTKHLCYHVNLFFFSFFLEKISSILFCLAKGKINKHTGTFFLFFILVSKWCKRCKVFNYNEAMQPNRGKRLYMTTQVLLSAEKFFTTVLSIYVYIFKTAVNNFSALNSTCVVIHSLFPLFGCMASL